jgi:hypothetical protein
LDIQPLETPLTEDDFHDTIGEIYVERQTSLLYEVKFFETFVLVRPASPAFYLALRKMSHSEFAKYFDEFYGDHEQVKTHIRGMSPEIIIE